mmetsp:Transcript_8322/g.51871  ORF Transcript_8322/g.51871 Transcript_8322/m.51871 type:complete len:123 (+) Transcript_8322:3469-3837(+)
MVLPGIPLILTVTYSLSQVVLPKQHVVQRLLKYRRITNKTQQWLSWCTPLHNSFKQTLLKVFRTSSNLSRMGLEARKTLSAHEKTTFLKVGNSLKSLVTRPPRYGHHSDVYQSRVNSNSKSS